MTNHQTRNQLMDAYQKLECESKKSAVAADYLKNSIAIDPDGNEKNAAHGGTQKRVES